MQYCVPTLLKVPADIAGMDCPSSGALEVSELSSGGLTVLSSPAELSDGGCDESSDGPATLSEASADASDCIPGSGSSLGSVA